MILLRFSALLLLLLLFVSSCSAKCDNTFQFSFEIPQNYGIGIDQVREMLDWRLDNADSEKPVSLGDFSGIVENLCEGSYRFLVKWTEGHSPTNYPVPAIRFMLFENDRKIPLRNDLLYHITRTVDFDLISPEANATSISESPPRASACYTEIEVAYDQVVTNKEISTSLQGPWASKINNIRFLRYACEGLYKFHIENPPGTEPVAVGRPFSVNFAIKINGTDLPLKHNRFDGSPITVSFAFNDGHSRIVKETTEEDLGDESMGATPYIAGGIVAGIVVCACAGMISRRRNLGEGAPRQEQAPKRFTFGPNWSIYGQVPDKEEEEAVELRL